MQRTHDINQAARTLSSSTTDWVVFFREILGLTGVMRQSLRGEELAAFQRGDDYKEILQMLTTLRKNKPAEGQPREEERVITVRLPKSMHDALKEEARERHTTVNKLCISKLLQAIEQELIPAEVPNVAGAPRAAQEASV